MFGGGEYSPAATSASENQPSIYKSGKNKNRFSDEQIRCLETMFESETKLEPRKKMEVARELGLEPRQVAVWFQNKRARFRSKMLERDYGVLKANFDNLSREFQRLNKEKQELITELQKLNELLKQKPGGESRFGREGELDNRDGNRTGGEQEAKPEHVLGVVSDDESIKTEYFGFEEEPKLLVEPADSSLTSSEDYWGRFDSGGLFDQSNCDYHWWDSWA